MKCFFLFYSGRCFLSQFPDISCHLLTVLYPAIPCYTLLYPAIPFYTSQHTSTSRYWALKALFFQDFARIVEKFGSHLLCLIRNEKKYKLLMIIFVSGQKKQMPTNFFKHLSRIQITKAADFSYCGFRVFRTITKSPIALFRSEPSQ